MNWSELRAALGTKETVPTEVPPASVSTEGQTSRSSTTLAAPMSSEDSTGTTPPTPSRWVPVRALGLSESQLTTRTRLLSKLDLVMELAKAEREERSVGQWSTLSMLSYDRATAGSAPTATSAFTPTGLPKISKAEGWRLRFALMWLRRVSKDPETRRKLWETAYPLIPVEFRRNDAITEEEKIKA